MLFPFVDIASSIVDETWVRWPKTLEEKVFSEDDWFENTYEDQ